MGSIPLHPKFGLNPTITCCFFCGKEKNEIALLGAKYRGEAPRHMVIDRQPCDWCRENMRKGIVFIEATGTSEGDCRPTGAYAVLTEEATKRFVTEPLLTTILQKRLTFVDPETWTRVGLRDAVERQEQTKTEEPRETGASE